MTPAELQARSRVGPKVCAVFVALLGLAAAACSAQLDDAVAAHRAGKYSEAISIYRRALSADANSLAARKGLARALSDTGEYADAEQTLRAAPAAQEAAVAVALADVLALQGKLADAEAAYRRGLRSQDSLSARVNLAVMQYRKGEHAAALDSSPPSSSMSPARVATRTSACAFRDGRTGSVGICAAGKSRSSRTVLPAASARPNPSWTS